VSKYCVYLTTYRGGRLPPFYIGYGLTSEVEAARYFGTVTSKLWKETWKKELAENLSAFRVFVIQKFDDQKDARDKEVSLQKKLNVVRNPLYVNRCAFPHYAGGYKGKKDSPGTRLKKSLALKGRKRGPQSPEHIAKLSKIRKGKPQSEELKRKRGLAIRNSAKAKAHRERLNRR
jgi:hypothetical protein